MKTGSIISNYWDLIEYNVHHIRHSELKASLILTAYGIIFGLLITTSTIGFSRIGNPDFIMVLFLFIAVILLIYFIFNIKSTKVNLIPKRLINFSDFFWANITHFFIGEITGRNVSENDQIVLEDVLLLRRKRSQVFWRGAG